MNTLDTLSQYYYTTTEYQTNTDPETAAAVAAGAVAFFLFTLIFVAAAYVVGALLLGRIFKKANVPSWIAWVPFYNNWKVLEIGGQQGFWAILALIPFVNIVSAIFMIIAMYHIGLKLGKSGVFVVWVIFLPIVWLIWLAVDKSTWNEKAPGAAPSIAPEHQKPAAA